MASAWINIECSINQPLVVAPAELALHWPGGKPTGQCSVYLGYFQKLMKDLKQAMPELVWEGHSDTPYTRVGSEAEAAALTKRLGAFVKTKDPASKGKKKKSFTTFTIDDSYTIVTTTQVNASDDVLEAVHGKDVVTWKLGSKDVLLWSATVHYGGVRARVTDDGFVLVDTEADTEALDGLVKGKATAQGKWTFDSGLVAVHWAGTSMGECKGLETNKLPALAAIVAKKPAATVKPLDKEAGGGAAVLKIAPGTYKAETGGDKKARWLRFTRA